MIFALGWISISDGGSGSAQRKWRARREHVRRADAEIRLEKGHSLPDDRSGIGATEIIPRLS
jgi:hypothetical protein